MKHYLLFYEAADDYAARRVPYREEHLKRAWEASDRGELVAGGALADPIDGAVLMFRGESPEIAERFAQADPYVAAGVVKSWRVREWTTVAGESAAAPVKPAATLPAKGPPRGFPDASEYPPYARPYVELVEGAEAIEALAAQQDDVIRLLESIDEKRAEFAYAPGKWSVKQVVNHVIDAERIFAYRALCIARNDLRPLPGFDENGYASQAPAARLTLRELRNEFQAVRSASLWLFRNLPEEAWLRRGNANQYDVTVRGLAFQAAGHERHHVKLLRERYGV
ncbi:MAG TPA: YciI-like protein [Bryobacteraceae bacterium]|nr:YciI-like protein [Bryobacteraceae bacterium]